MTLETVIAGIITVLSIVLFIIAVLSYRLSDNRKLIFVGLAFLLFFIKGVAFSVALFYQWNLGTLLILLGLFDIFILCALLLSTLLRF